MERRQHRDEFNEFVSDYDLPGGQLHFLKGFARGQTARTDTRRACRTHSDRRGLPARAGQADL